MTKTLRRVTNIISLILPTRGSINNPTCTVPDVHKQTKQAMAVALKKKQGYLTINSNESKRVPKAKFLETQLGSSSEHSRSTELPLNTEISLVRMPFCGNGSGSPKSWLCPGASPTRSRLQCHIRRLRRQYGCRLSQNPATHTACHPRLPGKQQQQTYKACLCVCV